LAALAAAVTLLGALGQLAVASAAPPRRSTAGLRSTVVVHRGQVLARARVRYRSGLHVDLVAARTVTLELPSGAHATIQLEDVPHRLTGPLPAGAPAGSAVLRLEGRVVARVPLVTAQALTRATLGERLGDYFSRPLTLALLAALVGCSLLLVLLRRRATGRRRARAEQFSRPRPRVHRSDQDA
jgi:D-alanyl-D-alanine carboxypeptidase (penicillin-binding protein 5/6)